jgi:hypothetical protein
VVFELPIPSGEPSVGLITFHHSAEVIAHCAVQFRDDLGSMQPIKHLQNQWERLSVLLSGWIESFVTYIQPQSAVLLL